MAGGSIEDLARTMGHSTTATTEKHYVHPRPDYYRVSTRNLLSADFGSDPSQTATGMATKAVSAKTKKRSKAE